MEHELQPVILLLTVGILAIALMRPLRLSPIVGYLLAGMLIGPYGFGLIEESETTHLLAELGVVFLLFDIGLHFTLSHIWESRRDILGLGPLQVIFSTIVLGGLITFAGLQLDFIIILILGGALALSSTAVVIQTLTERGQQNNPLGISSTSVLIFQDIIAIFLLILATSLGSTDTSLGVTLGLAVLKSIAAFTVAILIGSYLISPLFKGLAKTNNNEIFTPTALLIVFATAAATGYLDLSLTLGAFLGGMMIAGTPYRHIIQTEIKPFRGLLLGFFFLMVGMSLNPEILQEQWRAILFILFLLLVVKIILTILAALIMKKRLRNAIQMGFLLSQGSEFAFVIFAMEGIRDSLGVVFSSVFITAIAASMALTPPLAIIGRKLARRWANKDWEAGQNRDGSDIQKNTPVIIVGMGEIGCCVADALNAHDISYQALEADHQRFLQVSEEGYNVAFGDATDLRLMDTIRLADADTVIVTTPLYEAALDLTPVIRERYPNLTSIISVRNEEEQKKFEALNLDAIIARSFPRGLELAVAVLSSQNVEQENITSWMKRQQDRELTSNQN